MSPDSQITRFFKHSSVYLIGNLVNRLGAFLLLPLYTHFLTVGEYGSLELFYAVMAVVSGILSVGIAHATLRFYFEYEKPEDQRALVSTNLIASFVICAIGVMCIMPWSGQISELVFGSRAHTVGINLILATIVLELSSQVSLAYLRAIERSGLFVAIAFGKLVLQIATNVYLVVFARAGVEGVLLGNLLTVAAGWAVLTIYTVRHCGFAFHRAKAEPVLRYSFPFLLSTLVGLVSANADKFIINSILSLQALGLYALAVKFTKLLEELVGEPFNRAYGAFRFSIMHDKEASTIQARIVRYLLAVALAGALGLAYFTGDLLRLISDAAYWPAADIVPILVAASVLKVLVYPLQTGILYNKQPRKIFHINIVVAVVSVCANFVLISIGGIYGACVALVIVGAVEVILTNRIAQRFFGVRYEYRRWMIMVLLVSLFLMLGIVAGQQHTIVGFVLKCFLFLSFVPVLLISPAFGREEVLALKGLLARLRPRGAGEQNLP